MEFHINRDLPITLVEQIKGQITYAIGQGILCPGTPMPSVRELAAELDVAPMTITRVYRELANAQLLEAKAGVGTFVADITHASPNPECWSSPTDLHQLADLFIRQALACGHTPAEIYERFSARLAGHTSGSPVHHVAVVGNFRLATEAYARDVERCLRDLNVRATAVLRQELRTDLPRSLQKLEGVELVIAVPTRLQEIRDLLTPHGFTVVAVAFQVSPETRLKVTSIPRSARVGVVATYPEFLNSLLEGVITYGLPDTHPQYAFLDEEERVKQMLGQVDVVIYASGSERIVGWVPEGVEAFEYRHIPDPASLNRLRPLLVGHPVQHTIQAPEGGRCT
jgi:DNA-binding transcriptional regulator YhcF (GntR family)